MKNNTESATNRKCLPAEWSKQSAILFTWPHQHMDWSHQELPAVQNALLDMIQMIVQTQKVCIIVHNNTVLENVLSFLKARALSDTHIEFLIAPNNDTWIRDYGPIIVYENNQTKIIDFQFNGWGGKFPSQLDNAVTEQLSQSQLFQNIERLHSDLHIEGGALESDGLGTLLTTKSCLLNPNRKNPEPETLAARLKEQLGLQRILWLENSFLAGDDTDGHIDMLARFLNPTTIAYAISQEPESTHYAALKAMEKEIQAFRQLNGEPYQLVPIALPDALGNETDGPVPATYLNFLITNDFVFVPQYNAKQDELAINTLQTFFTGRKIIGIESSALIQQGGSLHCATMHIPDLQWAH